MRTVKNELQSSFDSYDAKVNELLELKAECQEAKEAEDRLSTILIVRTALMKEFKALSIELEAVASSVGSVSSGSARSAMNSIVKLEKLKCPKFSTIPRYFGQFKS